MSWKPLLDDDLALSAMEAARAIADALEDETLDVPAPSYAYGHAGIALLHGYLAAVEGDERAADRAEERLGKAVDGIGEQALSPSFYVSLPGVAWTSQHLEELLAGSAEEDQNEEVDDWIAEAVRTSPWPGRYDLIYGLIGLGRYALDHPRRTFTEEVVDQIVARLEEMASTFPEGVAWRTAHEVAAPSLASHFPQGYFDLGLSHGTPGAIAFLAQAWRAGFQDDQVRRLLDESTSWLLANRRSGDDGSAFAPFLAPGQSGAGAESCRSAWCYGDPGIAAALLGAARATGNPAWESEAVALALRDCARPFEDTGVADAELCHGAAGLGHLYNRFYQSTGEETFARTARRWFERALAMRRPGEGIGGYLNWWPEAGTWNADPGLLTGSAGIGLALLAAVSGVEPNWDRPMLIDLPTRDDA
ncbi:MAG TPA: lanthionine synthetase C family protein [Thermoanaerobaculia bacterium]|jgi:lantibiotic modifying enzyme|nr:lanthionine synthetase C family protein [Thermoanaerobaculia bacterium]